MMASMRRMPDATAVSCVMRNEPSAPGSWCVRAAAEFLGRIEFDHAHLVAVFLAEEHHGTARFGFFHADRAVLYKRVVGEDFGIHLGLHLGEFFVRDLREV